MTKKKPTRKKKDELPPVDFEKACNEILDNLYAQVEEVHSARLDALRQRLDEVQAAHAITVVECGQIIERLMAVEEREPPVGPLRRLLRRVFRRR